jgi:hypothetical protein
VGTRYGFINDQFATEFEPPGKVVGIDRRLVIALVAAVVVLPPDRSSFDLKASFATPPFIQV